MMSLVQWQAGDVIVERQVWHGRVTAGFPTIVVECTDEHLVTYVAPGAPFGFPVDPIHPSPSGRHPWYGRPAWVGHGMLAVIPHGGDHSVMHYWHGDDRRFACWYINIQEPMRPTPIGFDSQDLELDIVVAPDRTWALKDDELLDQRVDEGRWTVAEAASIRAVGARIIDDVLEADAWWWDTKWASWEPDPSMVAPVLRDDWRDVPVVPYAGLLP
jgi:hypothetical protein